MNRNRFMDEQIIGILNEHEAGTPVAELCRKHGVSDASIYKWKAKFGGMDVSEAKRLKTLDDENTKLKRLLADAMLDNAALKDLLGKNVWSASSVQGPLSSSARIPCVAMRSTPVSALTKLIPTPSPRPSTAHPRE
jgi:putative transposase